MSKVSCVVLQEAAPHCSVNENSYAYLLITVPPIENFSPMVGAWFKQRRVQQKAEIIGLCAGHTLENSITYKYVLTAESGE